MATTTESLHTIERSIYDFSTVSELKAVLSKQQAEDEHMHGKWRLENYDAATTVDNPNDPELEAQRLQNLLSYNVLDTTHNPELDELTKSAQQQFGVPIAAITILDFGRQYFASLQGLEGSGITETPREIAFCAHTIRRKQCCTDGVLVVPDATKDARFQNNTLVTGPMNIRFYAGAPIISPEGHCLGVLCLLDDKPRPEGLSAAQKKSLKTLAECAMATMLMD